MMAPSWGGGTGRGQFPGGGDAPPPHPVYNTGGSQPLQPPRPPTQVPQPTQPYRPTSGPVPPGWWMQRYGAAPMATQVPPVDNPVHGPGQPPMGPPLDSGGTAPNPPGSGGGNGTNPPPGNGGGGGHVPIGPTQTQNPLDNSNPYLVGDPWSSPTMLGYPQIYTNAQGMTTVNPVPGYMPQYTQPQGSINAPTVTPTGVGMSWNPGGPSTQQVVSNIMGSLAPQFDMQNKALSEQLADAGIVGGSAPGAMAQLGMQQQTQAMGDIAPYIMQGFGMQQQADLANQNWMNQLGEFNAGQQLQAGGINAQNSIGAQEFGQNLFQQNQAFNANQYDQAAQYDVANAIRQAMYNAGVFNTATQAGAQMSNTDWLAQLQANTALQEAGMGVQAGAFQPVFTQPAPVDFSGLAQGLAPSNNSAPVPSAPGAVWA